MHMKSNNSEKKNRYDIHSKTKHKWW